MNIHETTEIQGLKLSPLSSPQSYDEEESTETEKIKRSNCQKTFTPLIQFTQNHRNCQEWLKKLTKRFKNDNTDFPSTNSLIFIILNAIN